MTRKREIINSSSIFERFYLNLRRKFCNFIDTVDPQELEHSKSRPPYKPLLMKSNSNPEVKFSHRSFLSKTYRNSYSITQTLIVLKNFGVLS